MHYVEPGYRVPSATHIAEVARRKFTNGKAAIKDYLQTAVEFFAFTMDIWTSRANDAYLSLTCHFITSRWNMVTCVLATSPFPEHHTADNIVKKVKQVMADHGLEKKHLLSVVHDQCSNMELAGDKLHKETGNCQSYSCAAHRLQLCIEEGLSLTAISQALGAAKKLVTHFRHSALATAELRK